MGRLKNYFCDLYVQREKLIDQVADLDMAGPIEMGPGTAVQMDALVHAIEDLDGAIKQIGGEL